MEQDNYKDRTGGLIASGILEIIGGVLCLLFAAVTIFPVFMNGAEVSFRQMAGGMMVYLFLAGWLIWMGIGTIMAKRWAQTLMLAASWFALLCGIVAMGMMAYLYPKMIPGMNTPTEMMWILMIFTFAIMTVFYLVLPTIGILFYNGRNVRATCQSRHPEMSWPERCPLPLLILVMMMALASLSVFTLWPMNFTLPFFGRLISGGEGLICALLGSMICLVLAIGVYRMRLAAWWGVLALLAVMTVSQLLTFSRVDVMEIYTGMDFPQQTLEQLESWVSGPAVMAMGVLYAVIALAYLLWIKKYFNNEEKGEFYE